MRGILTTAVVCLTTSTHADVLRVDPSAPNGGDGLSWPRAFNSLTDALANANTGDDIWIVAGTFTPDTPAGRDATFTIPDGVRVFGGFRGDEGRFELRPEDPLDDPTVLSGAQDFLHTIVTVSGTGSSTLLDGLVIERGFADVVNNDLSRRRGGGIYGVDAGPTLRGLLVRDCLAVQLGGGIYIDNRGVSASVTIEDCLIEDCGADDGGGMYLAGSAQFTGTRLTSNLATGSGGGGGLLVQGGGVVVIDDCRIDRNDASNARGGGIYTDLDAGANLSIADSTIQLNTASNGGGGICLEGLGTQTIRGSHIIRNDASGGTSSPGAGVLLHMDSGTSLIENCLIAGNTSDFNGAGIGVFDDHNAFITNTTITGNTSTSLVAGVSISQGTVSVDNTIIWDNATAATVPARATSINSGSFATVTVNRSLVEFWFDLQGPLSGVATTDEDPVFIDADGIDDTYGTLDDNIGLMPGSPAIDAGNNLVVSPSGFLDVYGAARFRDDTGTPDTGVGDGVNPVVDIGAAEFQGTTPNDCIADTNGDGMLTPADFNAWIIAFNTQSPACDQNSDGLCTPADFNAWIINFNTGC